jgi:hypothetical protein
MVPCSPTAASPNLSLVTGVVIRKRGRGIESYTHAIDDWLTSARDAFAQTSDLAPDELTVDEHTAATILELARIAAHTSGERTNAPLLSYLAGLAVGQGAKIDDLAAVLRNVH